MGRNATSTLEAGRCQVGVEALSERRKVCGLKWYYVFSGANAVFMTCTFGGALFALYLSALGLAPARIGLLFSLFPFMQTVALVATPAVERLGYRRTFLWFYGTRKLTVMLVALAPWVHAWGGARGAFWFVGGCVIVFGLQRSLGETALYPWMQEFIPNRVLGRVQGLAGITGTVASAVGLVLAGYLIDRAGGWGLGRYGAFQLAYVAFACVGLLGVGASSLIPGGKAMVSRPQEQHFAARLGTSVRDGRFLRFLVGTGILQGSMALFGAFMPLYMTQVVGLPTGGVVRLTIAQMAGGVSAGYVCGRWADRRGSRPVLVALLLAMAAMPMLWVLLPALPVGRSAAAYGAYFLFGAALLGANVAAFRMMYNTVVPPEKKSEYLALRYAVVGVVAGAVPLVAGASLGWFTGLTGSWHGLPVNAWLPLFGICSLAWAGSAALFGGIREKVIEDAPGG